MAKGLSARLEDEANANRPAAVAAANQSSYQVTDADLGGGIAGMADTQGFDVNDFSRLNPGVQTLSRGQWVTVPAGKSSPSSFFGKIGEGIARMFGGKPAGGPPNPFVGPAGFARDLATQNEVLRGYQQPQYGSTTPLGTPARPEPSRRPIGPASLPHNRPQNAYGPQQTVRVGDRIMGYTPTTRLDVVAAQLASGNLPFSISQNEANTLGLTNEQLKEFYTTKLVDNNHFEYTLKPGVNPASAQNTGGVKSGTIIKVNGKNRVVAYDKNGNLYYRTDVRLTKPVGEDFTPVNPLNNASTPISVLDLKLGSG